VALTQRRLAATIKGRIERNDDRSKSFFDSIGHKLKNSERA